MTREQSVLLAAEVATCPLSDVDTSASDGTMSPTAPVLKRSSAASVAVYVSGRCHCFCSRCSPDAALSGHLDHWLGACWVSMKSFCSGPITYLTYWILRWPLHTGAMYKARVRSSLGRVCYSLNTVCVCVFFSFFNVFVLYYILNIHLLVWELLAVTVFITESPIQVYCLHHSSLEVVIIWFRCRLLS